MSESTRDVMEYEVAIVGAGPAGLSAAIRLKQLKPDISICVLEKGASLGAHSLSGAVMEPGPLDGLMPHWREKPPAVCVPATRDEFWYMTRRRRFKLPTPPQMANHGNLIVSLGQLTPILGAEAEKLGVDVFPGFAAAEALIDSGGAVRGVRIGDMGVEKSGEPGPNFAPGPEIHAKITMFAEGCRGSAAKQMIARYRLDEGRSPQTYGLGFKELWQLPPGRVEPGLIQHSLGWPLDGRTYGGSFLYHLGNDRVYIGFVVGLDYEDPRLKPFEAFQQFKNHPQVRPLLAGGEILAAGARTLIEGGYQSMPRLEMPGAVLIGDAGGTLNTPKIKGIHQAIRSGITAAEHYAETGASAGFDRRWRESTGGRELHKVRNIRPGFRRGLWFGLANAAYETVTAGKSPWTLANHADHSALRKLEDYVSPERGWGERELPPRDRLASVFFAATAHEENQPVHLHVADPSVCATRCAREFGNPCTNFCPANVYEMIDDGGGVRKLQINSSNCVHCKACDIKEPYAGQITWRTPEGGSGPNYQGL